MKKYEILKNDKINFNGTDCYRIKAIKDFILYNYKKVSKGDLGGYVSSDKNLSQEGKCWISKNSVVAENATVSDDAVINNSSKVYGNAVVKNSATIDNSEIFENAEIKEFSLIIKSSIKGNSKISNFKVENSVVSIDNSMETAFDSCITIKESKIRFFDLNTINVFNKKNYSFTLEKAILNNQDDCCLVPINFLDGDNFLVKYNSLDGVMFYNSLRKKENLNLKLFKRVVENLFEIYSIDNPSSKEIKPFFDEVGNYNQVSYSEKLKKMAKNIKNISTFSIKNILNYLEMNFISLAWLFYLTEVKNKRDDIIKLIEKIINDCELDIRSRKIENFGDELYLSDPIFKDILAPLMQVSKAKNSPA